MPDLTARSLKNTDSLLC